EVERVGADVKAKHLELDGDLFAGAPRRYERQRPELLVGRELQRLVGRRRQHRAVACFTPGLSEAGVARLAPVAGRGAAGRIAGGRGRKRGRRWLVAEWTTQR